MKTRKIRPNRKSLRLPSYDYYLPGGYFITIVTHNRALLFGEIQDEKIRLNTLGEIVNECWQGIPDHFSHIIMDEFVVMPNHIHGIIFIQEKNSLGARYSSPEESLSNRATHASPLRNKSGSLSIVVGSFKSAVTKRVNHYRNTPGKPIWQRSFYDRIIRDEEELHNLREYIHQNTLKWPEDDENIYPS